MCEIDLLVKPGNIFFVSSQIQQDEYEKFLAFLSSIDLADTGHENFILIKIENCLGGDIAAVRKIILKSFELMQQGHIILTYGNGLVFSGGVLLFLIPNRDNRCAEENVVFMFHAIQSYPGGDAEQNRLADESNFGFIAQQTELLPEHVKSLLNQRIRFEEAVECGILGKRMWSSDI